MVDKKKKIQRVEDFDVYQKAMKVFDDFSAIDLPILQKHFASRELARQQIKSLDSISSNMEEGYGRKAGKELKQFFRIARGSAAESKGRYKRCKRFLPKAIVDKRVGQLEEIYAMLHSLIGKLYD